MSTVVSCTGSEITRSGAPVHRRISRRALCILLLLGIAFALPFNGWRALWDTSETRYAEASREMAASGSWLVPLINNQPHLTKPPVAYWLYAASIKTFGKSEAAVRLPCAIAYALSAVAVALAAMELTGAAGTALLAGLLQLGAPLALIGAHVVTTDIFLAACEPAYMWALLATLHASSRARARLWSASLWSLMALAFLIKGPPALLSALAGLVFVIVYRKRLEWRRLVSPEAIVLFFALASSWYVMVWLKVPGAVDVWRREALHKVFVNSVRNMPAMYYPFILGAGSLLATVGILSQRWKKKWTGFHLSSSVRKLYDRPVFLFCAIWICVPLIIFMLAKTRLPLYVIPLVAPVNILGAIVLSRRWQIADEFCWRRIPLKYTAAGILLIVSAACVRIYLGVRPDYSKDMEPLAVAIRADAAREGTRPELFLTMTTMGNGLLYYLDGPPSTRLMKNDALPETSATLAKKTTPGPNRSLKFQAFSQPVTPGHAQYIVMDAHRESNYSRGLNGLFVPVFRSSQWVVWRRTGNYVASRENTDKAFDRNMTAPAAEIL